MIVLADLDGTLVDRAAAFSAWARRFALAHGGGDEEVRPSDLLQGGRTGGAVRR